MSISVSHKLLFLKRKVYNNLHAVKFTLYVCHLMSFDKYIQLCNHPNRHQNQCIKYFHHPRRFLYALGSLSPIQPFSTTPLLCVFFAFSVGHVNGIMECVTFRVLLFTLSIMLLGINSCYLSISSLFLSILWIFLFIQG